MVGEETVRIMNLLRKWSLSLLFPFSILVCNKRSTKTIIQKLLLPSNISPSTLLQALRSLVTTTRITVTANYTSQRVKIGSMYVSSTMVKSSMVRQHIQSLSPSSKAETAVSIYRPSHIRLKRLCLCTRYTL